MASQYKLRQLFLKFHMQNQLQALSELDNLTDVNAEAEVVEDVPEMRPESPESKDERVELPVVNPTSKPAVSGKREAPQTKLSAAKKPKTFSWTAKKPDDRLNYIIVQISM